MTRFLSFFVAISLGFSAFANFIYPKPKEQLNFEIKFGDIFQDEFKWMENHFDPMLWTWIDEQNKFTKNAIDKDLIIHFDRRLTQEQTKSAKALKAFNEEIGDGKWWEHFCCFL